MVSPTFVARESPSRSRFPASACGCGCRCVPRADRPARAALLEVLEPSPHRVAPPCPHFGPQPTRTPPAGAAPGSTSPIPSSCRIKTETVSRAGARGGAGRAAGRSRCSTATPDPWGFRHKVHFVFGDSGGRLTMGHLARGSRRVVPVEECRVHAGAGNTVAFALRDACRARRRPRLGAGQADAGGAARSGRARGTRQPRDAGDAGRGPRPRSRRCALPRGACSARARSAGLHLNVHQRDDGMIFGAATRKLRGIERLREDVAGVSFLISPTAFFQTNVAAAELLVRLVLEAVPADAPVLDLYAGAGLFALTAGEARTHGHGRGGKPRRGGRRPGQPAAEPHSRRAVPMDRRPGRGDGQESRGRQAP